MWTTKTFETLSEMNRWIADNEGRYQWTEIFVNNVPYALEFRELVEPRLAR